MITVPPLRRSLAAIALAALLTPAAPAAAQEILCDGAGDVPCGFQLQDVQLQKVPAVFKFQARVSQAKLPIGEGEFAQIRVRLLRGNTPLCEEELSGVQVRGSVLNLEIGRHMSCEIDEVIAENTNLAFQICLESSCLQPIELASTPYAVKASFASIAQQAHHANVAGQASYAHRSTADRDMFLRRTIGTGYFDYYTGDQAWAANLYGGGEFGGYADSGFMAWTPTRSRTQKKLHIVAKDAATDTLAWLDELVLGADTTRTSGDLAVGANAMIGGSLEVAGPVRVQSGGIDVTGNSHVEGDVNVLGRLATSNQVTVQAGGIDVTGTTSFHGGAFDVNGASTFHDRVIFTTDVEFRGAVDLQSDVQDATFIRAQNEDRDLVLGGALEIQGGDGLTVTNTVTATGGLAADRWATSVGTVFAVLNPVTGALSAGWLMERLQQIENTRLVGDATVDGAFKAADTQLRADFVTADNSVRIDLNTAIGTERGKIVNGDYAFTKLTVDKLKIDDNFISSATTAVAIEHVQIEDNSISSSPGADLALNPSNDRLVSVGEALLVEKDIRMNKGVVWRQGCPDNFRLVNRICRAPETGWFGKASMHTAIEQCHARNARVCTYSDIYLLWDELGWTFEVGAWFGSWHGDNFFGQVKDNNKFDFDGNGNGSIDRNGELRNYMCCIGTSALN